MALHLSKGGFMSIKRSLQALILMVSAGLWVTCVMGPGFARQAAAQVRVTGEPRLKVYDVRDFGATGDGKTLDTRAIAKAIHAAAAARGGRVVFSPGVYLTGTFEL